MTGRGPPAAVEDDEAGTAAMKGTEAAAGFVEEVAEAVALAAPAAAVAAMVAVRRVVGAVSPSRHTSGGKGFVVAISRQETRRRTCRTTRRKL